VDDKKKRGREKIIVHVCVCVCVYGERQKGKRRKVISLTESWIEDNEREREKRAESDSVLFKLKRGCDKLRVCKLLAFENLLLERECVCLIIHS